VNENLSLKLNVIVIENRIKKDVVRGLVIDDDFVHVSVDTHIELGKGSGILYLDR